ncbi:unnamed protein product [Sordaria macrospora k-hell]|uniref:WGS project CABT00000000 data, contig 2.55 n=1 Tax=Sordaria macrospora (strain ATCC MYA-333 / DSM 997 / K(L3346) / K-hell) TaxID=771870 RepID=F7W9U3_SORMK|nr:uncharacterized protein SMAC_08702 [Sordaria macrospora k-hell]KAH7625200.1 hypothetical protein B0T09DRAFT_394039 [Sordaria sp. MPI-SDFR-AT-0083]CCC05210.1 unnamed protein product [Sordaria macrospora k-hell]
MLHAKGALPCWTSPVNVTSTGEEVTIQAYCMEKNMVIAPYEDLGDDVTRYPDCIPGVQRSTTYFLLSDT